MCSSDLFPSHDSLGYRLCRAAKLLMSLGYGNFSSVIQYDIYAQAESYLADGAPWIVGSFQSSNNALRFV